MSLSGLKDKHVYYLCWDPTSVSLGLLSCEATLYMQDQQGTLPDTLQTLGLGIRIALTTEIHCLWPWSLVYMCVVHPEHVCGCGSWMSALGIFISFYLIFFSHWIVSFLILLDWLARNPQGSPWLRFLNSETMGTHCHTWSCMQISGIELMFSRTPS